MKQNMKQRMYITLYPETIKKLIEISSKNHRSKSAMIEKLINEYKEK